MVVLLHSVQYNKLERMFFGTTGKKLRLFLKISFLNQNFFSAVYQVFWHTIVAFSTVFTGQYPIILPIRNKVHLKGGMHDLPVIGGLILHLQS